MTLLHGTKCFATCIGLICDATVLEQVGTTVMEQEGSHTSDGHFDRLRSTTQGAVVVLAVLCLIVACISVALVQTRSAYTASFGSVLDEPPVKLASAAAAPPLAGLSGLNGGGSGSGSAAPTGTADALSGHSVGEGARSGSVPKSNAAAAAVGGGHGAAERSRGDEAFMSSDHSARLEGHLAGQAVDVHSGGVLGAGIEIRSEGGLGGDSNRREDLETVSQPREFFSPDELKRSSGSGNGGSSGAVPVKLSNGSSILAIALKGGGVSSGNSGGSKSADSSSGGADLLRDASNNATKASKQAGAHAQESSSTCVSLRPFWRCCCVPTIQVDSRQVLLICQREDKIWSSLPELRGNGHDLFHCLRAFCIRTHDLSFCSASSKIAASDAC